MRHFLTARARYTIIKRLRSDGRIENCGMTLLHEALMTANCETCFSFHSGNLWLLHLSRSSLQNCGLQWPTYYSIDSFSFDRTRFAHYGLLVKRKMCCWIICGKCTHVPHKMAAIKLKRYMRDIRMAILDVPLIFITICNTCVIANVLCFHRQRAIRNLLDWILVTFSPL